MGHPKKQKKKFEAPKKPYDKSRIESEKKIKQGFGLRRKHEIRRAESILRNFRRRARELQATRNERLKNDLLDKLKRLGLSCSSLEEVLEIKLDDILSRRLQTILFKKNMANSIKHARQMIVHGHVLVGDRKNVWPGYIVKKDEEDKIKVSQGLVKTGE